MAQPPITQYTNPLHKYHDPDAPAVKTFLKKRSCDPVLQTRAKVLNKLFKLNKSPGMWSRTA